MSEAMTYRAPETIHRMLLVTWALLSGLNADQRSRATFGMDDPGRLDWDFIPKPDRTGVPLFELDRHQRTIAHSLLKAGLSMRGYSQAVSIMATENVLRELNVLDRKLGIIGGDFRDPDAYYLSFFGRPGFEDTWAWRVVGHHLSLSYTIVGQEFLTVTPSNMGAQPCPAGVLDPLGLSETLAFGLLGDLDSGRLARTVIHDVAPADFVTRQVPRVGARELPDYVDLGLPDYRITDEDRRALQFVKARPSGICGRDLSRDQFQVLRELVHDYVGRVPDEIARQYASAFESRDPGQVYFAWAGATKPGQSHYYRIHTPDLLIESDNAMDNGNHIHSVWRDLNNDLGHDVLLDHYSRERHSGHHLASRLTSTEPDEDVPAQIAGARSSRSTP
jgi:hypothetical protein